MDAPEFDLPSAASEIIRALGPAAKSWQEGFAFAPILFVLARRSDGMAPADLAAHLGDVAEARRRGLAATYGLREPASGPRRRGQALDLASPDWRADCVTIDGARLQIDAGSAGAFAYLWRSQPMDTLAGATIRVRGVVLEGGLSAGLLQDDRWAAQAAVTKPGPFELSLRAPAGSSFKLVICNNDNGCGAAIADIDCTELIAVK